MIDDTLFFVMCAGPNGVKYFQERDLNHADLDTTLTDLMDGQFSRPLMVIRLNIVDHTSADESEDVARELATRARDEGHRLPHDVLAFIKREIGAVELSEYRLEAA